MAYILEIRGLTYEYVSGVSALQRLGFYLEPGESLALIGANGAGKSTLLQLILGILQPSGGEIFYEGGLITKKNLPVIREKIGLIFQSADNQLFCNTVYEDVLFGVLNMGIPPDEAAKQAELALADLGISHLAQRAPYQLSAGEKRLGAIAAVLAMHPTVLLMDEPSAELDPRARRGLIELLNRLPQSKIIATHDLDLAVKTCERTLLLCKGQVAAMGKTADILYDEELLQKFGL